MNLFKGCKTVVQDQEAQTPSVPVQDLPLKREKSQGVFADDPDDDFGSFVADTESVR
jgi:hypothetical protein